MSGEEAGQVITPRPSPLRPRALLRRRWPVMLASFVLALGLAVFAALWLPPTFVSTGTILIEQQEVPLEMVRSTISSFADQRIQMINQRVMTSENLLRIVEKYDLYGKQRKRRGRDAILDLIRDDIEFGSIKATVIDPRQGRPVEATIAFSLSYRSRSPETAARVANELSSLYLQENLNSRRQLAEQAAGFLSGEGDKLSERIDELQSELAEFKSRHVNNLPEQANLNMQLASRADDEIRNVDTRIRALDQQIVFLDSQLLQLSRTSPIYASTGERVMSPDDRLKYLQSEYARLSAVYAPDHPDVLRTRREIDGLALVATGEGADQERQRLLEDATTELAGLRQRYSADHPDVQRQQRLVETLAAPAPVVSAAAPRGEPDNPAWVQLRAQREASSGERTSLERKREELSAELGKLEQRLATTPGVEKEYMALLRELDSAQLKYREVRQKYLEAQLAQNLEAERKGERFTLIDPPVAPDEPASPNRRLILVVGMLLAFALAGGVAVLLEVSDPHVRSGEDVAAVLAVPPLAAIPWILNDAQRAAQRRRVRYSVAASAATCALAVFAVHHLYRPLDVLWAVAVRRLMS